MISSISRIIKSLKLILKLGKVIKLSNHKIAIVFKHPPCLLAG